MVPDDTGRLFEELDLSTPAPLAERMRPRTVDEFVGQAHVTAPGKLVRQIIVALTTLEIAANIALRAESE